jgi:hypothetical protein
MTGFACLVALAYVYWMIFQLDQFKEEADKNADTPSDYTLMGYFVAPESSTA